MTTMTRGDLPLDVRLMNFTSRWLVWLFVAGALASGGKWLMQRPLWAIHNVVVEGDLLHVSEVALRSQALPRLQGNWFTISLANAQQTFEQVPWVRKAVVQRVWPLSLLVTLEAQKPLAVWHGVDGMGLVNVEGQRFEANLGEVQDLDLPQFAGPQGSEERVTRMAAGLERIFAPRHWRIASIALGADDNWRVQIKDGPSLDLGGDADARAFAQRIQRFLVLVDGVQARYGRPVVAADLRYATGFAVRLQGADAQAAPGASAPKAMQTVKKSSKKLGKGAR